MYVPFDETDAEAIAVNQLESGLNGNEEMSKLIKLSKPSLARKKKALNNENEKTREKMLAIRNKMNEAKKLKSSQRKSSASQREPAPPLNEEVTAAAAKQEPGGKPAIAKTSSSNLGGLKMKRYQIIGEPSLVSTEAIAKSESTKSNAQEHSNSSAKSRTHTSEFLTRTVGGFEIFFYKNLKSSILTYSDQKLKLFKIKHF